MQFEYKNKLIDIEGFSQEDHIYKHLLNSYSFYEKDLLEYIYKIKSFILPIGKNSIFIDVGANIGNHSIFFGLFMSDFLIAIEANPKVVPILRRNLSKNIKQYIICDQAVGEFEGFGTVEVPQGMDENIGASKINIEKNGGIKVSTLDNVFLSCKESTPEMASVALIKIDVEGMELQVLKGAEKILKDDRPHIFLEAATPENLKKLSDYLKPLGYKKMIGHWSSTPVHHFVYRPSVKVVFLTFIFYQGNLLKKIQSRLFRIFRNTAK